MSAYMTEDEFRESIVKKYQGSFYQVSKLHHFVQEWMSTAKVNVSPYRNVLWLVLAKGFKSFDSVRRLCEIAYCEDAGILLRSLLNLLAIVRWISLDPPVRSAKYLGWFWIEMRKDAERHKDIVPPDWIAQVEKHYESARRIFEYKDGEGNVRMARKWHQPEAHTIEDLFKQTDLEEQYEDGYRLLSGVEHSDATAYFPMIVGMEKGADTRSMNVHDDRFVPDYLRNAFQYFADIFRICNGGLGMVAAGTFEELANEGMEFFRGQSKG